MSKESVYIRFPNESFPFKVYTFNLKEFKVSKIYSDEVFGYWKSTYIALDKTDYTRLLKENKDE